MSRPDTPRRRPPALLGALAMALLGPAAVAPAAVAPGGWAPAAGTPAGPAPSATPRSAPQDGPDRARQVEKFERYLASRPYHERAFDSLMEAAVATNGVPDLVARYEEAVAAGTATEAERVVLARLYARTDRTREALEVLRALEGGGAERWKLIGGLELDRGEHEAALEALDRAAAETDDPRELEDVHGRRGKAFLQLGRRDDAAAAFRAVAELRPEDFDTRLGAATELAHNALFDEALVEFEVAERLAADDAQRRCRVLREIGRMHERLDQGAEALAVYDRALSLLARGHWLRVEMEGRVLGLHRRAGTLERELIPSRPFPVYDENYSVSTISDHLRELADQQGEELLERRKDAWPRLLATFRAIFGGLSHDSVHMPAYGGRLFDPDRFPFLEGRTEGSSWRSDAAQPLPIDNRSVLHILESLQLLEMKGPGGGPAETRRLSFKALDIEQIGHVYEGLLDHTAVRAKEPFLGLAGAKDREPETPLSELEKLAARDDGQEGLLKFLRKETGRSQKALEKGLAVERDPATTTRFLTACQRDEALWERVRPFAGLLRNDTFGYPIVIPRGSVFVTAGTDRRASGTHYTMRSLTEPVVQHTLEPVVYEGPAEGADKKHWKLKSAAEILELRVCDMAMGSGAFLVQACRYLSERLVEAWARAEEAADGKSVVTPEGAIASGAPEERALPQDAGERMAIAQRTIVDRCLFGVDKNPMAVEMAKLSLWLLTLQRDKPFTFVDHASALRGLASRGNPRGPDTALPHRAPSAAKSSTTRCSTTRRCAERRWFTPRTYEGSWRALLSRASETQKRRPGYSRKLRQHWARHDGLPTSSSVLRWNMARARVWTPRCSAWQLRSRPRSRTCEDAGRFTGCSSFRRCLEGAGASMRSPATPVSGGSEDNGSTWDRVPGLPRRTRGGRDPRKR